MPGLASLRSLPNGPGLGPPMAIDAGQQKNAAYLQEAGNILPGGAGTTTYPGLGGSSFQGFSSGFSPGSQGEQAAFDALNGYEQAAQIAYQAAKTIGTQTAQFGANGVRMSGSPLGITAETSSLAQVAENFQIQKGLLESRLYGEQGLQNLAQGNAALFEGQATALSDEYNYKLQKAQAENEIWGSALSFGIGTGFQAASLGLSAFKP